MVVSEREGSLKSRITKLTCGLFECRRRIRLIVTWSNQLKVKTCGNYTQTCDDKRFNQEMTVCVCVWLRGYGCLYSCFLLNNSLLIAHPMSHGIVCCLTTAILRNLRNLNLFAEWFRCEKCMNDTCIEQINCIHSGISDLDKAYQQELKL